jgi:hypothetical protein
MVNICHHPRQDNGVAIVGRPLIYSNVIGPLLKPNNFSTTCS